MPGDVNPFEPWRPPPEPGDSPRKPWQLPSSPDGIQLPGGRTPRRRPGSATAEERAAELLAAAERRRQAAAARRRQPAVDDWAEDAERRRQEQALASFLRALAAMVVAGGGIGLVFVGGGSLPRMLTAMGFVWMAFFLALKRYRDHTWRRRLGAFGGCLLAAALCWLLVPTTGGWTYAGALVRLEQLRRLPEGAVADNVRIVTTLAPAFEEFPGLEGWFRTVQTDWLRRTIDAEMAAVSAQGRDDLTAAVDRLRQFRFSLGPVREGWSEHARMTDTRRRVYDAYLAEQMQQLRGLLKQGDHDRLSRRLQELSDRVQHDAGDVLPLPDVEKRLVELRGEAVRGQTAAAVTLLAGLLKRADHEAVAREGVRLTAELEPAAKRAEMAGSVAAALEPLRGRALQARIDAAARSLEQALAEGKPQRVPALATEALQGLRGEARLLDRTYQLDTLHTIRRRALETRLAAAEQTLTGLLARGDHAGVAASGARLWTELADEAATCGQGDEARSRLEKVRRQAFQARLEAARRQARTLLAADRFQAVGELGDQTHHILNEEAGELGEAAALSRFRDSCRVFADLARKARLADRKP